MENCPFCKENNRVIIEENKSAIIFFSNPRLTKGHLLVTPKRHVEKPWKLTEKELFDIFCLLFKYQPMLADTFGGCDIKENYRPFIKQNRLKIDHVHFHLVPRSLFDKIYEKSIDESKLFEDLKENEIREITELIKAGRANGTNSSKHNL